MPSKRNNIRHNHNYTNNPPPPMTVSASLSPPPCSQMRPTIANRCTIKSIIDFHRSRLEHPSQGGDIIAKIIASLRCRWKIKKTAGWWWRHPHSPTQLRPIRSNPTNAKTSWIDFHCLLWVRRRYQRQNDPSPSTPWKNIFIAGWWRRHSSLPHSISTKSITPNHR